jgi:ribosomal protein L37AE/L43A
MEISQHAKYTCTFCGKVTVKRTAVGIWDCKSCKKVVAGGAYVVSYVDLETSLKMKNWKSKNLTQTTAHPPLLPRDQQSDVSARLPRFRWIEKQGNEG